MKASDIVIGEYYRHKDHPNYCWAKPVKIIKPMQGENKTRKIMVKCEYMVNKNDCIIRVMYFSPKNLIKDGA